MPDVLSAQEFLFVPPEAPPPLTILHFNDVYEISPLQNGEPCGGVARFASVVSSLRERAAPGPSLLLFSGDALSPSLLSTVVRGRHMVDVFNAMPGGISGGVIGNHDLDHGVVCFESLCNKTISNGGSSSSSSSSSSITSTTAAAEAVTSTSSTLISSSSTSASSPPSAVFNFNWLLSNVKVTGTNLALGNAHEYTVIDLPNVNGSSSSSSNPFKRVGLFGIWERDVILTLATVDSSQICFEEPEDAARRLCKHLRENEGCDLVIALTHMRGPNDDLLARAKVPGLDLILGGHDHDYAHNLNIISSQQTSSSSSSSSLSSTTSTTSASTATSHSIDIVPSIKSGSDFRFISEIRLSSMPLPPHKDASLPLTTEVIGSCALKQGAFFIDVLKHSIVSTLPEDPTEAKIVAQYEEILSQRMESVIGLSKVALDARFASVRTTETAIGNLIADLMRHTTNADVAILNSGTLRADAIIGPGLLRMRDLVRLLPLQDSIATVSMSGKLLLECLENGVSAYPRLEGRFLQVSGMKFSFDPSSPPGHRIVPGSVLIQSQSQLEKVGRTESKDGESARIANSNNNINTSRSATVSTIDDAELDSEGEEEDENEDEEEEKNGEEKKKDKEKRNNLFASSAAISSSSSSPFPSSSPSPIIFFDSL